MSEKFTQLFSSILDSSVWLEDLETKVVWITLLAMKDLDGVVHAAVPGIAHRAGVSLEACERAMEKFQAPDPSSRSREYEGRRIARDGRDWIILNNDRFRSLASRESECARKRRWWEKHRAKSLEESPLDATRRSLDALDGTRCSKSKSKSNTKTKRNTIVRQESDESFEEWYKNYPRHDARKAAEKAWRKLTPLDRQSCLSDSNQTLPALRAREKQFIPLPASYLNGRRWEDEAAPAPQRTPDDQALLDAARRKLAEEQDDLL